MLKKLRGRQEWQFFGVLPKADPGWRSAWWVVPGPARGPAGRLRDRHGRAGRRGAEGHDLVGPLALIGVVFVLLQVLTPIHTAVSANLGDRTAAWLYDRLTDACVAPAGHGPPRGSEAHQRPHRRARLRPRHDRPAAVDLDGLHRRRPGRDDRRPRVGRRACSATRWWAPLAARRRLAGDALAAARERGLARPQHRRGARRAARRRLRLPPGRRSAGRQGAAPVRPGRLDDRPLHRPPHPAARAAVRGDPAARAAGALEHAAGRRRQRRGVLVARRRRAPAAASTSARSSSTPRARSARR